MDLTFNPGSSIAQGGMCFMFHCAHHPSQLNHPKKCKKCVRIHGKDTEFTERKANKNIGKNNNAKA